MRSWLVLASGVCLALAVGVHASAADVLVESAAVHVTIQELDRDLQELLRRVEFGAAEGRAPDARVASGIDGARMVIEGLEREVQGLDEDESETLGRKILQLRMLVYNLERAVERGGGDSVLPEAALGRQGARTTRAPGKRQPPNDDCGDAVTIGDGSWLGDTSDATNDGQAGCGASMFTADVWFRYVAAAGGLVFANTYGSSYDTVLSVHTDCPGTVANQLDCNDDSFGLQSSVSFYASAGGEYLIRVSGAAGATGSFVLNVGPGAAIEGTITEEVGGAAVEGVWVRAYDAAGYWVASDSSDSLGEYSIGSLGAGIHYAATRHWNYVYIDELYDDILCPGGPGTGCGVLTGTPIVTSLGATMSPIDFALDRGGVVAGTVVESGTGVPIEDASVSVYDNAGGYVRERSTGAAGQYAVAGLPSGSYFAVFEHDRYADELYDDLPCPGGTPYGCDPTGGDPIAVELNTTSTANADLDRLGAVSGTVTEVATGDPIAWAWVVVLDASGSPTGGGDTDGAGFFHVGGLATGTYFVFAQSYDHRDELYDDLPCEGGCDVTAGTPVSVTLGSTTTGIDFALDRFGRVSGTVTALASGQPVVSTRVELYDDAGAYVSGDYSDGTGVFLVERLDPGTYFARTDVTEYLDELYDDLSCEGGCDVTAGNPIAVTLGATATGIDFALTRLGEITGVVTDAASVSPLSSYRVTVWNSTGVRVGTDYSDGAGVYSVTALAPGTHFVVTDGFWQDFLDEAYDDIPCPGGPDVGCDPTAATPVAVSLDTVTSGIDFALDPLGGFGGTVVGTVSGQALPDVRVRAFDTSGANVESARTDASGAYVIEGLDPGTYFAATDNLVYFDELYDGLPCEGGCDVTTGTPIAVAVGSTTSGVDFALDRMGEISGTVVDTTTGMPIPTVSIVVFDPSGSTVDDEWTDVFGGYSVRGLTPGIFFVVTNDGSEWVDEAYDDLPCPFGPWGGGCDPTAATPVPAALNTTTSGIDFALDRGAVLTGTVTDEASGGPIENAEVWVWDATGVRRRRVWTDPAGRWSAVGLPTGTYFAAVEAYLYVPMLFDGIPCPGGLWSGCDPTTGTPIQAVVNTVVPGIDFALPRPGVVAGHVSDATTGWPLDGARVEVWDGNGTRVATTWSTDTGSYSVGNLPPSTVYVTTDHGHGYLDELYDDQPCLGGAPTGCDPTKGTQVVVNPGAVTGGIDFALSYFDSAVSGSITDAVSALPLSGIRVDLWDDTGQHVTGSVTGTLGTYLVPAADGTYYASTHNVRGFVDEVFDDVPCPNGSALSGLCDPLAGDPVVVVNGQVTAGIDFALDPVVFADGFESGDTSAWYLTVP